MSRLFWLSEEQVGRIRPFFPKERGVTRVDAPIEYGPHKTLYNRFRRWSENSVFERIFEELAKPDAQSNTVLMIDATHLKAHRTASSLKKGR